MDSQVKKILLNRNKVIMVIMTLFAAAMFILANPYVSKAETSKDGIYRYEADYYKGTCTIRYIDPSKVSGDLVIPAKIDGLKVTGLDILTSKDDLKLTSLKLSDGCTYVSIQSVSLSTQPSVIIKKIIFPSTVNYVRLNNIDGLTSVSLPAKAAQNKDDISEITECKYLKKVVVNGAPTRTPKLSANPVLEEVEFKNPDKITTISNSSFYNCPTLSRVTKMKNLQYVDNGAFADCKKINVLSVINPSTTKLKVVFSFGALLSKRIIVPESVTKFGDVYYQGYNAAEIRFNSTGYKIFFVNQDMTMDLVDWQSAKGKATIYAGKGSTAHSVAKRVGIKFVALKRVTSFKTKKLTNSVKLTWRKVKGISKYHIYKSIDGKPFAKIATVRKNYYVDTKARKKSKSYVVRYKVGISYKNKAAGKVITVFGPASGQTISK